MVHALQSFKLVTKARKANIPHGVAVEGTVVGVKLIPLTPELPTRRMKTRTRLGKQLLLVKFCDIKQIDFTHLPPGDGKQLESDAIVRIKGLNSIVAKALDGKRLTHARCLNIRASFYANGALNVKFLSLTH